MANMLIFKNTVSNNGQVFQFARKNQNGALEHLIPVCNQIVSLERLLDAKIAASCRSYINLVLMGLKPERKTNDARSSK